MPLPRLAASGWTTLLLCFEATVLLVLGVAHLGVDLGLGEPRIPPAAAVEIVCALCLGAAAWAVAERRPGAWELAVGASVCALIGVLVAMSALALGAGPQTVTHEVYHRVLLVVLVLGLVVLFARPERLRSSQRTA
jgi:hypothetical protein